MYFSFQKLPEQMLISTENGKSSSKLLQKKYFLDSCNTHRIFFKALLNFLQTWTLSIQRFCTKCNGDCRTKRYVTSNTVESHSSKLRSPAKQWQWYAFLAKGNSYLLLMSLALTYWLSTIEGWILNYWTIPEMFYYSIGQRFSENICYFQNYLPSILNNCG